MIPDEKRYGLIDGGVFMIPVPNTFHQDVLVNIALYFKYFYNPG